MPVILMSYLRIFVIPGLTRNPERKTLDSRFRGNDATSDIYYAAFNKNGGLLDRQALICAD